MKIYRYKDVYGDLHDFFSGNIRKDHSHKKKLKEILLLKEEEDKKKEVSEKRTFNFDFTKAQYKYSLAAVSAAALFVIVFFSFKLFFALPDINSKVLVLNGNAEIKKKNKKDYKNLAIDSLIKTGDIVRSDKNSNIKVIFENNSIINIYESSQLKFVRLNKIKKDEKIKLFLDKGSVFCTVNLSGINSYFEVLTNISKFTVKGTEFLVTVLEHHDIKLDVDESVVEVGSLFKPLKKLDSIEKKDESIYKRIVSLFNYSFRVNEKESVIIRNGLVERINQKLSALVEEAFVKTNNKDFSDVDKNELISKINELENEVKTISASVVNNFIPQDPEEKEVKTINQNTVKESSIKKDTRRIYIYDSNNKDMFIGQDVLLETVDGSFLYGILVSHDGKIVKIEDETLGLIAIESYKVKSISFKR